MPSIIGPMSRSDEERPGGILSNGRSEARSEKSALLNLSTEDVNGTYRWAD
jgi:hypothetical protein